MHTHVQMSVQLRVPGKLSTAGDVQGSTVTPLFAQPDGFCFLPVHLPFKFFEAHNLYKWEPVAFCFPRKTKGETEREDCMYKEKAPEEQPYSWQLRQGLPQGKEGIILTVIH